MSFLPLAAFYTSLTPQSSEPARLRKLPTVASECHTEAAKTNARQTATERREQVTYLVSIMTLSKAQAISPKLG